MLLLSPSNIKYLPGLDCQDEEDMIQEKNVKMLLDTVQKLNEITVLQVK